MSKPLLDVVERIRDGCSVYALFFRDEHAGSIWARCFKSGVVKAYVSIWSGPLTKDIQLGKAGGFGYDKLGCAICKALGFDYDGTFEFEKYLQGKGYKIIRL